MSDALARGLTEAGEAAGEQMWRMPLHAPYAALIESEVADQSNAATKAGAGAGAITAALFLQRFVGSTPWAHLDIAGPMNVDADDGVYSKGATGFGTRLLIDLACNFTPPNT